MTYENFLYHWREKYPQPNSLPEDRTPNYYGISGTHYINVKCPYCPEKGKGPDKKHHCHAHYEQEWFKCQRCGTGGTIHYLLGLRKNNEVKPQQPWGSYTSTQETREKNKKVLVRSKGLETTHCKPGSTIAIDDLPINHVAWQYLLSEGFTQKEIESLSETYGIYYCIQGKEFGENNTTTHRLIFEIKENGTHYGWQARWLPSQWPKTEEDLLAEKEVQKYLISPGLKKSFLLYNWDLAQEWDMWILVEGVKKVWKTGKFSLGPFGISNSVTPPEEIGEKATKEFWSVRLKEGNRPVGILYDKDGFSTALCHAEELREMGVDAKAIPLPSTGPRDLDNYQTPEIKQIIKNHMGRLPKRIIL